MLIAKRHRDKAMRIIRDYFWKDGEIHNIGCKYLYLHGFPKRCDADKTLRVLDAMGYIKYRDGQIQLTDKGKAYPEESATAKRDKWVIPIAISVLTYGILRALEWLLPLILRWFASAP